MNPVRATLRYPQVTLALTAILVLVGITALFTMPRREDPKITINDALVYAVYPGATTEQVESQVTHKIEERLFHFSEIRRERTFSTTRNGLVIVNVELNKGVKDADAFWSRLRLDMAQLKTELPDGVQGPGVDSDFGDTVAVLIGVHSERYGYRELKDYAQRIEDALRTLPAVSKIQRIGDQKEQILVSESQRRLSQYGVNPQHVVQALQGRSTIQFAGRVPSESNQVPLQASGHFATESDLRHLIVDMSPTGVPIYLGDLATIERSYADPSEYARINGQHTILLAVEMHEGNNIVAFGRELSATLYRVQQTLPPDVHLDLVANQPRVVSERIGDFFREFGIAIVAVIMVTMLLLPMRVALVASIAIPITVSITFAVLNTMGIELHQVSIAALVVVLGMVVDDAIVIADNYVELLDRQVPREEAAWRCASEMAIPVLTATLTIIASFAPLLLLSGSTGEFIRALPITVSIALATSFVVAMLLTPLTARFFIREGLRDQHQDRTASKLTAIDRMQRYYNCMITWAMDNRKSVLVTGVAAFLLGLVVLQLVKQQFFPLAERDQFVMDVWLPEGSRIAATDMAVRDIEKTLLREHLGRNYASFLGTSAPRFYYNISPQPPAENYAQILVNTASIGETPKIVDRLRKQLPSIVPQAKVFVKELQQGDDMEAPVEVRISGNDEATLRSLGSQVDDILRHTAGASYVHTDWHEPELHSAVHLNAEIANRQGFTNSNIAQQLAAGLEGVPVATFWEGDRNLDIVLRLTPNERQSFENVSDTYVQSPLSGASVPLRAVATLSPEWQAGRIVRRNGVRTLTVRAFADQSYLPSQVLAGATQKIQSIPLPSGYRIEYGGEDENQRETFGEMMYALGISLVLIFLILLFQFRTFTDPLIIMTAFPLALPGAALGLFLTGNPFGFTAFIGIISLGGLVVRNSIILIDFIYERMKAGTPLVQAAMEAGERRLRPIFLTTMAAAVGVTPMILSGSSLWAPMASVIAFGLIGSMFFTLIAIPVLFVVVHGIRVNRSALAVTVSLVMCLALTAPAHGQTRRLTIDEAIQLAGSQNSTVRLSQLKVKEAEARVTQARANYFPNVTNETNAMHSSDSENLTIPKGVLGTYSNDGAIPGKDVSIKLGGQNLLLSTTTAAQPLLQLFKIHAGVSVARAETAGAKADARHAKDEIELNVKKLYYGILTAERHKHAAELRIRAGEERLVEAHNAVATGAALPVQELEGTAELASGRFALGSLDDTISDLRVELNNLLGIPLETELELAEPADHSPGTNALGKDGDINAPTLASAAGLRARALAHNSEVDSARQAVAKAKAGLDAARAEFIPDLSLYAQNIYQSGVPLLPSSSNSVGLRLEWTLSEFGKRTGQVRERQTQVAEAKENVRLVEDHLQVEVEKTLRKLRRCESGIQAARAAVTARTEARRIVSDKVEAKTENASALTEADAKLAEAQSQLFEARMNHETTSAELEQLLGTDARMKSMK